MSFLSFKNYLFQINETFDSNSKFRYSGGGQNWKQYSFNIDDREYTAEFVSKNNDSDYELIFTDEKNSIEETGSGKAFFVFSNIFNIIKDFIKIKNPKIIRFSAKGKRQFLYDVLSKKLANKINYSLDYSNLGKEKEYILTRI